MNKTLLLIVALALMLSMAGCQPEKNRPQTAPTEVSTVPETTVTATEQTTTEAPTTQPQETEAPATVPPTTVPPATEPSTTETSTTTPPTTVQPTTEVPTTIPPATGQHTTEVPTTQPPATQPPETVQLPEEAAIPNSITAVASGEKVESNEFASIDYSNTEDGYVMVCYTATTAQKLKAQVKGPVTTYTYSLTPGTWAAFPLSDENGDYQISVFENVVDSKYAVVLSATVSVSMEDEFAPFLRSNQYVNFDNAPRTVAKAAELTAGVSDPLKKVEIVYDFVVGGMTYDEVLAQSVKSGYTPDLDAVLSKMTGICFDYAALMTGMLRSQGVPAKLVVGYASDAYHAWINVWSETDGWVDGVIWFDGASWKRMDPTFASTGGSDMLEYIGSGSNYTAKYFY